jgi:hypothetical protein
LLFPNLTDTKLPELPEQGNNTLLEMQKGDSWRLSLFQR